MSLKQIVKGHLNEWLDKEGDLSSQRLAICKACPLYKLTALGPICNPALYLNPETNEVKHSPEPGFTRGCSCRLNAKTRIADAHCPSNKW